MYVGVNPTDTDDIVKKKVELAKKWFAEDFFYTYDHVAYVPTFTRYGIKVHTIPSD